jgi:hypothetical protein
VSDLIAGLISRGSARLLVTWRDRARGRDLDRGGKLSAPCALRIVDSDKARWQHGQATADGDTVVWRSRTGKGQTVLRHGSVRLLTVRSPTARESWFIRDRLLILRLRSDEDLIDVALLPAEARYFREILGLPTD